MQLEAVVMGDECVAALLQCLPIVTINSPPPRSTAACMCGTPASSRVQCGSPSLSMVRQWRRRTLQKTSQMMTPPMPMTRNCSTIVWNNGVLVCMDSPLVYDWFVHRPRILTVCSPAMVNCLARSNCMRMFTVQFLELDHIIVYKPMLNGICYCQTR